MAVSGHDLRRVKELLWDVVSSCLKPAEKDEVRRALGWEITAKNETLFVEAALLADIMGTVQLTTAAHLERHRLCSTPQRNMAEAEVRMLMERLRDFGSSAPVQSRSKDLLDTLVPKAERAVSSFLAAGVGDLTSRPRTPPTRPASAASPNRPGTASSTASSRDSGCSDPRSVVKSVHSKLNIYDLDAIKGQLQQALQDEHAALLDDLEYLQSLLDGEFDFQAKAEKPAASAEDLVEYSKELQEALNKAEHEARLSQIFSSVDGRSEEQRKAGVLGSASADEEQSRASRLRGVLQAARVAVPLTSSQVMVAGISGVPAQELAVLSPKPLPRPLGMGTQATSSRASIGAESPAASLPAVRAPRTSLSSAAAQAGDLAAMLDQRLNSPGSSTSGTRPDSGESGSSRIGSLLASRPSLGSPQAPKSAELASPLRLQPLADVDASGLASPLASSRAATLAKPAVASLPPKPVPLGQRATASSPSTEGQERVSSGGIRRSPSSLGRPPEAGRIAAVASVGGSASDGRKQSHYFAMSSTSQVKAAAGPPMAQGRGIKGVHAKGNGVPSTPAPAGNLNLVAALDAEVDAVMGGVAAILAKHNYRPSSAGGSRPGSAAAATG